jgi:hypothetical protein
MFPQSRGRCHHRRLLGGSVCTQILFVRLFVAIRYAHRDGGSSFQRPHFSGLSAMGVHGTVFTPSPSLGNPYSIQFSRYYIRILFGADKSGHTRAQAAISLPLPNIRRCLRRPRAQFCQTRLTSSHPLPSRDRGFWLGRSPGRGSSLPVCHTCCRHVSSPCSH